MESLDDADAVNSNQTSFCFPFFLFNLSLLNSQICLLLLFPRLLCQSLGVPQSLLLTLLLFLERFLLVFSLLEQLLLCLDKLLTLGQLLLLCLFKPPFASLISNFRQGVRPIDLTLLLICRAILYLLVKLLNLNLACLVTDRLCILD